MLSGAFKLPTTVILLSCLLSLPAISPTAVAYSPTKDTYDKCYADKSLPLHFARAKSVIAATYRLSNAAESTGLYNVLKVWKGPQKEGSILRFQLPSYDRRRLMVKGTTYLFFVEPTKETSKQAEPLYTSSSCYYIAPVSPNEWDATQPTARFQILESLHHKSEQLHD